MSAKTVRFTVFVGASIFASGLNYLTYPILARLLSDASFVEITVALSLLTQISAFLSSLVALTVGLTKDAGKSKVPSVDALQSVLFRVFIAIVVVFCVSSPLTFGWLKIPVVYALPVAAMLLFSVPTAVVSGYYNGKGSLVKLGLVGLMTALFQFALCVGVAITTKSGVLALAAMGAGQVLSLVAIYTVFRGDPLPKVSLAHKATSNLKLIRYAAAVSVAVMLVNLLQIADLLIAKSNNIDIVTYTDFYVIGRVVFFGGMILIWPFLSWLDTHSHAKNTGAVLRVSALLSLGCAVAFIGMVLFGDIVTRILTGSAYDSQTITALSFYSVLYKLIYLILILFVLYFTVMRSYWAVLIPLVISALVGVYAAFIPAGSTLSEMLQIICSIGVFGIVLCVGAFWLCKHERLALSARLQ